MSSPAPWDDAVARLMAAGLGLPIEWPNEAFARPDPATTWLQADMTGDVLEPIEMGPNGVWQEEGFLQVHIHVPRNQGTRGAREIAKTIANLFRGLPTGPIVYGRASIGSGDVQEPDGMWWRLTIHIDYRYQDIVS